MQCEHTKKLYEKRKESGRADLRRQVVEYCGTVCANCGSDREVEYHHIVPLSNGGTNQVRNFVALCSICHLKAHGKLKYRNIWSREITIDLEKPNDADASIEKFLKGELSKGDICNAWGIRQDVMLHYIPFFRKYLERHEIVSYQNFVNLKKNLRANSKENDKEVTYLASVVIYHDGTEERYYRTMKNGRIVSMSTETIAAM